MTGSDEKFEVVRCYDPAVIAHNPDDVIVEYMRRRDFETLEVPPTAMVFKCQHLSRSQRRLVRAQANAASEYEMSFRFGVIEVRNAPGGRTLEPMRSRPGEPITDAGLDSLGLAHDDEQEIGLVIRTKSFLARDVPLSCPQLDSSVHAYSVVAYHLAEQKKDLLTQTDE